jgi:transcriptional regulator with XRE-family HTH domain
LCLDPVAASVSGLPERSPIDPTLAAAVRSLREQQGRTQEDLAHDVGVTVNALARIERGQADPRWTTVRRIAGALGVSIAELGHVIEGQSDPPAE